MNAAQISEQWRAVHAVAEDAAGEEVVNGHSRRVWRDARGHEVVELNLIKGMAHGVPLAVSDDALGEPGSYMLDAGISSTARIACRWGLADDNDVARYEGPDTLSSSGKHVPEGIEAVIVKAMHYGKRTASGQTGGPNVSGGVGKVINDALRAAGLLR